MKDVYNKVADIIYAKDKKILYETAYEMAIDILKLPEIKAIQVQAGVIPNEVIGGDNAWDIYSIINKLCEATDILLHKKDYDGHGWEEMEVCYKLGKKIVDDFNSRREV